VDDLFRWLAQPFNAHGATNGTETAIMLLIAVLSWVAGALAGWGLRKQP
jgi:hypothetical protein